jgi:hypothetical protein
MVDKQQFSSGQADGKFFGSFCDIGLILEKNVQGLFGSLSID